MSLDTDLEMTVSLSLSCKNLQRKDLFSKSDPYAQIFLQDRLTGKYRLVGRTETITNAHSPRFAQEIIIPYRFEEEQMVIIRVWDDDFGKKADDFLGETIPFKLGTLMGSRGQVMSLQLFEKGRELKGSVRIHAEPVNNNSTDMLFILLEGKKLDRKDGPFFKSDPFFIISAAAKGTDNYVDVFKSEWIRQDLNPKWKWAQIPLRRLKDKDLKLTVIDWDYDGSHDLIGIARITLEDLLSKRNGIELIHPPTKSKYRGPSYRHSGLINVCDCYIQKNYSMIDYLRGGIQINLMVAIDFTGSNGDPRVPGTNHYGAGQLSNNYTEAVRAVGNIVVEYDTDKMIPCYGFGAKAVHGGEVSHCFPLTGDHTQEQVHDIDGVIGAYASCFERGIVLSGPTHFTDIIHRCTAIASSQSNTYSILLLLTDGEINDMQSTIDAICRAASAPLSIIIVGVGEASFGNMHILDADSRPLVSSRGMPCPRDIVQFIPYNQIARLGNTTLLAQETLRELPEQLVEYFKQKNIPPGPPIDIPEEDIPVAEVISVFHDTDAHVSKTDIGRLGKNLYAHAISH